ncbi:MAG: hypothetical protein WD530_02170, partial [Vicingaceae bacterium]
MIIFIFFNLETFAQKVVFEDTIAWQSPIPKGLEGENTSKVLYFSSAQYEGSSTELPFYYKEIDVPSGIIVTNVDVVAVNFVDLESEELSLINPSDTNIKSSLRPIVHNSIVRKQNKTYVKLYPFVRGLSGQVSKVNSFELEFTYDKQLRGRTKSLTYKSQSALSSGEWYKIASTQRGVYKLTKHFLQQLGVDVDNVDPRTIRLFGHGGGMLPESNSTPRPDDLVEMAIEVKGESDGSFDAEDYVAFYGESQVKWTYNENAARFEHEVNRYCDT